MISNDAQIIDAHQHFWTFDPVEFGWIDDSMAVLRRDHFPEELAGLTARAGVHGTVAVQARQCLEETDWLLGIAEKHPALIRAVVGWIPLAQGEGNVMPLLEKYAAHTPFKGVRHVLQAEEDSYMSGHLFLEGLSAVAAAGLTYDILVVTRQLPAAIDFVDRRPGLPMVLDHIAKPVVQGLPAADWVRDLRELARREHVNCKFSGVVTEVPGRVWSLELIRPYFEAALEAFGPGRLMFGSDWPVCRVAADYEAWVRTVRDLVGPLTHSEQEAILGGNACRFYKIQTNPS
jgi:L-fuconolactonase